MSEAIHQEGCDRRLRNPARVRENPHGTRANGASRRRLAGLRGQGVGPRPFSGPAGRVFVAAPSPPRDHVGSDGSKWGSSRRGGRTPDLVRENPPPDCGPSTVAASHVSGRTQGLASGFSGRCVPKNRAISRIGCENRFRVKCSKLFGAASPASAGLAGPPFGSRTLPCPGVPVPRHWEVGNDEPFAKATNSNQTPLARWQAAGSDSTDLMGANEF